MELRQLRYFIRAAELLNFTRAAESLYVSQPTLSVQINQLEKELGTELFSRVGRSVRLTESGRVFLKRARQVVKELEEGSQEIDAINGLLRGNLCLSSLPLYGSRLLSGWVSMFVEQHPGMFLRVKPGASEDIEAGLLSGAVDLGFTILPIQHSELSFRELLKDEIVLVVADTHVLADKSEISLRDLHDLPMALPSERIAATQLLTKYFDEHKIVPRISLSYDDGHALLELVKKGRFVTFLPKWGVKGLPDIRIFPLPGLGVDITAGAVWANLSAAAKAFLDLATEQATLLQSEMS